MRSTVLDCADDVTEDFRLVSCGRFTTRNFGNAGLWAYYTDCTATAPRDHQFWLGRGGHRAGLPGQARSDPAIWDNEAPAAAQSGRVPDNSTLHATPTASCDRIGTTPAETI